MVRYVTPAGIVVEMGDAAARSIGFKPADEPTKEPKKSPAKKASTSKKN